ncbi:MAG: sigma-70 family RNA polymerase sigma factor [Planctomycetota bacterium]
MAERPAPPSIDELLAERAWIRRLAGSLVGDASTADDLAQEAMLAAVEHPPRERGTLSVWLARVLRNFARLAARREIRRRVRKEAVARQERLPSTTVLLERLETQRIVAEGLQRQTEPYRTTLVLRFYEDVPSAEIAAHHGVSAATVRSRLQRGLALLRDRLDARWRRDREAWIECLAPWAVLGPAAIASSAAMGASTAGGTAGGVFLMKKVVALVVVVLLGLFVLERWPFWVEPPGSSSPSPRPGFRSLPLAEWRRMRRP